MYQMIVSAMQALAEAGTVFGLLNSQKGEDEFQRELGKKLEHMTGADGWSWRYVHNKEERFETAVLNNKEVIKVDIVGRHCSKGMVAIELKYVTTKAKAPSNPPAFPYDMAKDCLRLDLLRAGHCQPAVGSGVLPVSGNLQTYVIGMTDWPDYWHKERSFGGWASNFMDALRANPVRFEGVIKTAGRNPEKTIFKQGRGHIAFGSSWAGEWNSYSKQFRYLLLRPTQDAQPQWTHHQTLSVNEQSAVYPFLNTAAREEHFRHEQGMWASEI